MRCKATGCMGVRARTCAGKKNVHKEVVIEAGRDGTAGCVQLRSALDLGAFMYNQVGRARHATVHESAYAPLAPHKLTRARTHTQVAASSGLPSLIPVSNNSTQPAACGLQVGPGIWAHTGVCACIACTVHCPPVCTCLGLCTWEPTRAAGID